MVRWSVSTPRDIEAAESEVVAVNERIHMKRLIFLFSFICAATVHSQDQRLNETLQTDSESLKAETRKILRAEKPNEIITEKAVYSGIAVQVLKTDNLVQLINPFAPAEYGSGADNLVSERDPIVGRPTGLSVLTVKFGR